MSGGVAAGTESGKGDANELLDTFTALGIADRKSPSRAITGEGLLFAAELCEEIAACRLEERVGRIFFHERGDHCQSLFVALIVSVQIQCEIKACDIGCEHAISDHLVELQVVLPDHPDEGLVRGITEWEAKHPYDPRKRQGGQS